MFRQKTLDWIIMLCFLVKHSNPLWRKRITEVFGSGIGSVVPRGLSSALGGPAPYSSIPTRYCSGCGNIMQAAPQNTAVKGKGVVGNAIAFVEIQISTFLLKHAGKKVCQSHAQTGPGRQHAGLHQTATGLFTWKKKQKKHNHRQKDDPSNSSPELFQFLVRAGLLTV